MISSILIKPEILVKNQEQVDEIKKLMDLAEKNCFVSNSVKAEIKVIPEIKTGVSNE
jgi:organic hydroperoxide reductase OsmC/OhrA